MHHKIQYVPRKLSLVEIKKNNELNPQQLLESITWYATQYTSYEYNMPRLTTRGYSAFPGQNARWFFDPDTVDPADSSTHQPRLVPWLALLPGRGRHGDGAADVNNTQRRAARPSAPPRTFATSSSWRKRTARRGKLNQISTSVK